MLISIFHFCFPPTEGVKSSFPSGASGHKTSSLCETSNFAKGFPRGRAVGQPGPGL